MKRSARLRPEAIERARDELAQICGPAEDRQCPGLQPAHVQQARHKLGEPVDGLLGAGQQFLAIVGFKIGPNGPWCSRPETIPRPR